MNYKTAKIIKSSTSPSNTTVIWLDLSAPVPKLKAFVNGSWVELNSESAEVDWLKDYIDDEIDKLDKSVDLQFEQEEQAIQGVSQDVTAVSGRVTTLENTYENTMNIANQLINELVEGKALIASALTDRGYPTQPTDSSASMAQKIENMSYDAGWLAQLGYSETNDGGVKDAVAYSKAIKDGWNPSETTRKFTNDRKLVFFPSVDTSQYTSMQSMFDGCYVLSSLLPINTSNVTNLARAFCYAAGLTYLPPLDTRKVTNFSDTWMGCTGLSKVEELSFKSTTYPSTGGRTFHSCSSLKYALLKDLGTLSNQVTIDLKDIPSWGAGNEENRMSLVHSLRDFSSDRATAEYSACTITLHADTLARLTAQEIAAITAKGFTLTS